MAYLNSPIPAVLCSTISPPLPTHIPPGICGCTYFPLRLNKQISNQKLLPATWEPEFRNMIFLFIGFLVEIGFWEREFWDLEFRGRYFADERIGSLGGRVSFGEQL